MVLKVGKRHPYHIVTPSPWPSCRKCRCININIWRRDVYARLYVWRFYPYYWVIVYFVLVLIFGGEM
jgi:hypothetical protein